MKWKQNSSKFWNYLQTLVVEKYNLEIHVEGIDRRSTKRRWASLSLQQLHRKRQESVNVWSVSRLLKVSTYSIDHCTTQMRVKYCFTRVRQSLGKYNAHFFRYELVALSSVLGCRSRSNFPAALFWFLLSSLQIKLNDRAFPMCRFRDQSSLQVVPCIR